MYTVNMAKVAGGYFLRLDFYFLNCILRKKNIFSILFLLLYVYESMLKQATIEQAQAVIKFYRKYIYCNMPEF